MTDVTRILSAIEQGDPQAAEQLLPLVYDELWKLAAAKLAQEKPGQTLEATALVHEAYLRLAGDRQFANRRHFFAAAAQAMRRILIDAARRKQLAPRVAIEGLQLAAGGSDERLLELHDALDRLATEEPTAARIVEARVFAGLSTDRRRGRLLRGQGRQGDSNFNQCGPASLRSIFFGLRRHNLRANLLREIRGVAGGQGPLANVAARLQVLVRQAVVQEAAEIHGTRRQPVQEYVRHQPPRHTVPVAVEQVRRAVSGDRVVPLGPLFELSRPCEIIDQQLPHDLARHTHAIEVHTFAADIRPELDDVALIADHVNQLI
jgi:RNA polymerase sigma factor (TIGR02999 family)